MLKLVISLALLATTFADVSHLLRSGHYVNQYQPHRIQIAAPLLAVPAHQTYSSQQIPILRQDQDVREDGSYQYAYETGNGISAQETGSVRNLGPQDVGKSAQGSYSYTSPEGEVVQVSYVADENGYQASGSHIPTPPPVPVAIQRALDWIAAHPQPQTYQTAQTYQTIPQRRFF